MWLSFAILSSGGIGLTWATIRLMWQSLRRREPDKNRSLFVVADEGVRPILVIDVVSRNTRRRERVDKVRNYALIGVQGYAYLDVWERRRQIQL